MTVLQQRRDADRLEAEEERISVAAAATAVRLVNDQLERANRLVEQQQQLIEKQNQRIEKQNRIIRRQNVRIELHRNRLRRCTEASRPPASPRRRF